MHSSPSRYTDDVGLPTLRDLAGPIFRYRRMVAVTFLAVMAVVVAVAAFSSRTYEAHMKILVKRERLDPIVTTERQAPPGAPMEVSEIELFSEVELLLSRDLLEQVVTSSGLLEAARRDRDNELETNEALLARSVQELRGSLDVAPIRKTTLIGATYRSRDPKLAARVLDQLAALYLAKHLAVHRQAGARQFFSDQTGRFQAELQAAEAKLNEFVVRENVVSALGERESTLETLSKFEATLQETGAAIADVTRRLTAIDAELAGTPARQTTQIRDGGNLELVRGLRGQILQLEIKRGDLLQKFTPQYPPLLQVEAELKQLREALSGAERAPLQDETTDRNPTHQWLAGERARVRTEHDALLARASATRRTIDDYRQRASRLDSQSVEQQELIRDVKAAEENYMLYQRKQEEARISDELDRTRIANVALAEAPSVPQVSRSRRATILVGGLLVALMCSLASAFILHALNPYFRTPDEVYRVLDIPVLASLPAAAD